VNSLNLTLEDENKSQEITDRNNDLLERPSEHDSNSLWFYLRTIEYEIENKYLSEDSRAELNELVTEIKNKMKIDISEENEFDVIQYRINQLDNRFNRSTGIQILDVPGYVKSALRAHNVRNIMDICKLSKKDINYLEYYSGTHFDIIRAELKRLGLSFPPKEALSCDVMNNASYFNAYNVDLIRFFIDKSELSNERKQQLRESLLGKITTISEQTTDQVDKKLSDKLEELDKMYKLLEDRKNELENKLESFSRVDNQNHTDIE